MTAYIETVANTIEDSHSTPPAPRAVMVHAMSLRTSDVLKVASADASQKLELTSLSDENQRLFQTRIFGGLATKLALASYYSKAPVLHDLTEADQKEELEILVNRYAQSAVEVVNDGLETTESLLLSPPELDLFPDIPNKLVRSWVYASRRAEIGLAGHIKNFTSYVNFVPGTFPPKPYFIKSMGENDAILTQAFGRDRITDDKLVDIRDERQRLGGDDAMMAHLDTMEFVPGPSNDALADEIAFQLTSDHPTEQILQWEVTHALYHNHPEVYAKYRHYIHTVWPHSGFYPTYEVKRDSIAIMDKIGLYNPIELAHGDMMARALAILAKQGVQADPLGANIPFDPGSTQPHVRDASVFMRRELLARGEHWLRRRVKF